MMSGAILMRIFGFVLFIYIYLLVNIIFALPFIVACVRELLIPVANLESLKASVISSFSRQMSVVLMLAQLLILVTRNNRLGGASVL